MRFGPACEGERVRPAADAGEEVATPVASEISCPNIEY
jgi:hypothetical protein